MKKPVFIDSSAWFALAVKKDRNHLAASRLLPLLLESRPRLVTSNHVLGESYTAILKVLGNDAATGFVRFAGKSRKLELLFTPLELEKQAYRLLERYDDQDFSFVDATSFVWMKRLGIREAFAFDSHFVTAGFTLLG